MRNRTKKHIVWLVVIFIVALILAFPSMVNTKQQIVFKTQNVSLKGNLGYYTSYEESCESDECSRSYCLNSKEIPVDIKNYKVCLCCVNFDFKENKNGEKKWNVKDYKLK